MKSKLKSCGFIPTGLSKLDAIMGGGVPIGRISQFSGQYASGKTTVATMIAYNAQNCDMSVFYADTEGRVNSEYLEALQVNVDDLHIRQGLFAEDFFDEIEAWMKKHHGLVILDSVGGLLSRKDAEAKSGEEGYPTVPRLLPGWLKRMQLILLDGGALVLNNHEKTDFMSGQLKILGGKSVEYQCDMWVRFRKLSNKVIKQGDEQIGKVVEAKIMKGRHEGKTCELHLLSGRGFVKDFDLLETAVTRGIVTKQGNTYFFNENKLGTATKARQALEEEALSAQIKGLL